MGWAWIGTVSGAITEAAGQRETEEALRIRLSKTASARAIGWPLRTWRENPSALGNYRPRLPNPSDASDTAV